MPIERAQDSAAEVIAEALCMFNAPGPTPVDYMPDAANVLDRLEFSGFTVIPTAELAALRQSARADKDVAKAVEAEREACLRDAAEVNRRYHCQDGQAAGAAQVADLIRSRSAHPTPKEETR